LVAILSNATKYDILQHILCVALGGKSSSDGNKVTSRFYHMIRNIEGIHKLASLGTTLTINMQL
jgi:hypothetical protein